MTATPIAVRRERVSVPGWLLEAGAGRAECRPSGVRRKASYLDKTVAGAARMLRAVLASDDIAARPGLLQRVDPRAKVLSLVVLLVSVGLARRLVVLAVACVAVSVVAAASRVPMRSFLARVWLFVPAFTGVVVAPATLSAVTPGRVVVPLWHLHGHTGGLTAPGLTSAGFVITRVATSVSLVLLVTLTTRWPALLAGLRGLGVPRFFVLVAGMAYRYLFVLAGLVSDMFEARTARSAGAVRHDRSARKFLAASAGALFGKAGHLSEEVHAAMVSRGYRGQARVLDAGRWDARSVVVVICAVAAGLAVLWGDLVG